MIRAAAAQILESMGALDGPVDGSEDVMLPALAAVE